MKMNGTHSENPIACGGRGISSDAEGNTLLSKMASTDRASPGCYRRHEFHSTWRERGRPGNKKWNFGIRTSLKKQERICLFPGVGSAHSTPRLGKPVAWGRGRQTKHIDKRNMTRTQWRWVDFLLRKETTLVMSTNLQCIRDKARMDKKLRFSSLLHHITKDLLLESLKKTSRSSAAGCDGIRKEEALETFPSWSSMVIESLHKKSYQAPPVRRVWIPKPGKTEKRPIGVPTVSDRTVQRSVSKVLENIYEEDFLSVSFGGRPHLSAQNAVCTLKHQIQTQKVNWVLECDIKNFFGSIDHGWAMRFIEHRVADTRILSLIKKWLKAGVMEDEVFSENDIGTPQGGSISVLLSNVYLHYVLDLWFEKQRKKTCQGQAYLIRYLDDFVICFQLKSDAEAVRRDLQERLGKFGLQLEPEKTKLLNFGRFSAANAVTAQKKAATFNFLGFTFCAGRTGQGKFLVLLRTEKKRINRFLQRVRAQLQLVRHNTIQEQVRDINSLLRGHFRYFGVGGNIDALSRVHRQTAKFWRSILNTRSQKANLTWAKMNKILEYSKLQPPRLSLPYKLMPAMVRL